MPSRDRRLNPDLERALPADSTVTTGYRRTREPWEALFGDGQWHAVQLRARWADDDGREVVLLEWSATGERWTEAYVAEAEKIRRV